MRWNCYIDQWDRFPLEINDIIWELTLKKKKEIEKELVESVCHNDLEGRLKLLK